jgi:glutamine amidotransferase
VSGPVIIGCCGANLASLGFAFERLGVSIPVVNKPAEIKNASHVILPGVGAAKAAMERLQAAGFADVIPRLSQPVLGICVGMQMLFTGSGEEDTDCLGIIDARVERLPDTRDLPVPEMGWNQVTFEEDCPLLDGIESGSYAYFVHSYAAPPGPYTQAITNYGVDFSAVVKQNNFYGTQFHPERSSAMGSRLLQNFLDL